MIRNLVEMFLPEQQIYLENIAYERIDMEIDKEEHALRCEDNIAVKTNGNESVSITVTRTLNFEPEELFSLKVSFGALLKFAPEKRDLYDWDSINMAEEFRMNGDFITGNLMGRISLQIAQITSSFGQAPLILPPNVAKEN